MTDIFPIEAPVYFAHPFIGGPTRDHLERFPQASAPLVLPPETAANARPLSSRQRIVTWRPGLPTGHRSWKHFARGSTAPAPEAAKTLPPCIPNALPTAKKEEQRPTSV